MCIERRLRALKAEQALLILTAIEASGRDVLLKKRSDGWHVVSESVAAGDYRHRGDGVIDVLGQYAAAIVLDAGIELGSSELDELGDASDDVVVYLEPILEFAEPVDPQSDEYEYALSLEFTEPDPRDTEPPPRLFCVWADCDQQPADEGLCIQHLNERRRAAELDAAMGVAAGDAE